MTVPPNQGTVLMTQLVIKVKQLLLLHPPHHPNPPTVRSHRPLMQAGKEK